MSKFIGLTSWLLLILTILIIEKVVEGRTILNALNKEIIKTIKVDNDEIIDCYDIYKQPSLDHPLLLNHTIQMRPNLYPKGNKSNNFGTLQLTQIWHKYGSCPEGTIPIRRNEKNYNPSLLLKDHRLKLSSYDNTPNKTTPIVPGSQIHEYATIRMHGNFLGASAKINLWNPTTEILAEGSISQIWVTAGETETINTIETGWLVNLRVNGDYQTRFFIYFTANGYMTGCYNLDCNGFVQISQKFAPGCGFTELSTFNGDQKDATFSIHKDQSSGNWWIQLQGEQVGYYPSSLFTDLSTKSTEVTWGGEIFNFRDKGRHTSTQMGSGHLPSEGHLKTSSYFNWVQVVDENYTSKDPENVQKIITNPNCYDLEIDVSHNITNGFGFYYGGPGYSDKCQ